MSRNALVDFVQQQCKDTSAKDSLAQVTISFGGVDAIERWLRWHHTPIQLDEIFMSAQSKAKAVVDGVEAKALQQGQAMDSQTREYVTQLALREAVARILQTFKQQQDQVQQSIASPFAQGARFNQLGSESLSSLVANRFAIQPRFCNDEWQKLLVSDAQRAMRVTKTLEDETLMLKVDLKEHILLYPALYSMTELMSALPSELNLKASSQYCELRSDIFLWSNSFEIADGVPFERLVMSLAIVPQDDVSVKCQMSMGDKKRTAELKCGDLLLVRLPSQMKESTLKFVSSNWMLTTIVESAIGLVSSSLKNT